MTIVRMLLLLACLIRPADAAPEMPDRLEPGTFLEGRFRQERILAGLERPLVSEGRFLVVPGLGLIWRTETPLSSSMILTGAGMDQYVGERLAMRLSADRLPGLARLHAALAAAMAGELQALERDFDVRHEGSADGWQVRLVPRVAPSATLPFSEIVLRGHRHVEQAEIGRDGGDMDRILFSAHRIRKGPPDAADLELLSRAGR
ncbi:MAG: outer membrane lipoprotein carrier protein LolA [Alphaproteobacteria bacterium]|nr:outer membrane lipoprotein carrier protein LolA [Alphaproteobacteria bacterium]